MKVNIILNGLLKVLNMLTKICTSTTINEGCFLLRKNLHVVYMMYFSFYFTKQDEENVDTTTVRFMSVGEI